MDTPAGQFAANHIAQYFSKLSDAEQVTLKGHLVYAYLEGFCDAIKRCQEEIPKAIAEATAR